MLHQFGRRCNKEDGTTFEENAIKKALTVSNHFPFKVIADDSGLEVEALDGAPGIYSARYAEAKDKKGENISDEANCEKLLKVLASEKNRNAQFRCVLVIAQRGKVLFKAEGVCRGKLIKELQGTKGFGYDPLFVPEGFEKTFAELSSQTKNQISHRAAAIKQLKKWLEGSILT